MDKSLSKSFARDLIALGSIPFFVLVAVRVSLLNNPSYLSQFIIGGLLILILSLSLKSDSYAAVSLLIAVFLSLYYNSVVFSLFAAVAYILILVSLFYLGKSRRSVFMGVLVGFVSTVASFFLTRYFFK